MRRANIARFAGRPFFTKIQMADCRDVGNLQFENCFPAAAAGAPKHHLAISVAR